MFFGLAAAQKRRAKPEAEQGAQEEEVAKKGIEKFTSSSSIPCNRGEKRGVMVSHPNPSASSSSALAEGS